MTSLKIWGIQVNQVVNLGTDRWSLKSHTNTRNPRQPTVEVAGACAVHGSVNVLTIEKTSVVMFVRWIRAIVNHDLRWIFPWRLVGPTQSVVMGGVNLQDQSWSIHHVVARSIVH
jgi:hypothetical protein